MRAKWSFRSFFPAVVAMSVVWTGSMVQAALGAEEARLPGNRWSEACGWQGPRGGTIGLAGINGNFRADACGHEPGDNPSALSAGDTFRGANPDVSRSNERNEVKYADAFALAASAITMVPMHAATAIGAYTTTQPAGPCLTCPAPTTLAILDYSPQDPVKGDVTLRYRLVGGLLATTGRINWTLDGKSVGGGPTGISLAPGQEMVGELHTPRLTPGTHLAKVSYVTKEWTIDGPSPKTLAEDAASIVIWKKGSSIPAPTTLAILDYSPSAPANGSGTLRYRLVGGLLPTTGHINWTLDGKSVGGGPTGISLAPGQEMVGELRTPPLSPGTHLARVAYVNRDLSQIGVVSLKVWATDSASIDCAVSGKDLAATWSGKAPGGGAWAWSTEKNPFRGDLIRFNGDFSISLRFVPTDDGWTMKADSLSWLSDPFTLKLQDQQIGSGTVNGHSAKLQLPVHVEPSAILTTLELSTDATITPVQGEAPISVGPHNGNSLNMVGQGTYNRDGTQTFWTFFVGEITAWPGELSTGVCQLFSQ